MINKPPPFKVLNIKIPIIIPIMGRGFINPGFGLHRPLVHRHLKAAMGNKLNLLTIPYLCARNL